MNTTMRTSPGVIMSGLKEDIILLAFQNNQTNFFLMQGKTADQNI